MLIGLLMYDMQVDMVTVQYSFLGSSSSNTFFVQYSLRAYLVNDDLTKY